MYFIVSICVLWFWACRSISCESIGEFEHVDHVLDSWIKSFEAHCKILLSGLLDDWSKKTLINKEPPVSNKETATIKENVDGKINPTEEKKEEEIANQSMQLMGEHQTQDILKIIVK